MGVGFFKSVKREFACQNKIPPSLQTFSLEVLLTDRSDLSWSRS